MLDIFNQILLLEENLPAKDRANLCFLGSNAIEDFGADVYKYVDGNLEMSLLAEKSAQGKNVIGEIINNKALSDAEYRYLLVSIISAYGIRYSLMSYKKFETGAGYGVTYQTRLDSNSNKEYIRTIFMRQIYKFLTPHQICLIAEKFDSYISENKIQTQTR